MDQGDQNSEELRTTLFCLCPFCLLTRDLYSWGLVAHTSWSATFPAPGLFLVRCVRVSILSAVTAESVETSRQL